MHVNTSSCLGLFGPHTPTSRESGYAHMNETAYDTQHTERIIQETSEGTVRGTLGYLVVETALEVTAYALGDR
ncbi:hypothetical protein QF035_010618 [Streptomyces umbrinus]|uniref:Uncharacterized protein n=1 Tax=Streptomyces umbrinus TaxID=67370 RepID=A0ABU0TB50_9ACTN|nr:hypothetical protein [Streptomyces umbrinus]MDQ1033036.1 hypothetical protein [Streptomyces umbrinus]